MDISASFEILGVFNRKNMATGMAKALQSMMPAKGNLDHGVFDLINL